MFGTLCWEAGLSLGESPLESACEILREGRRILWYSAIGSPSRWYPINEILLKSFQTEIILSDKVLAQCALRRTQAVCSETSGDCRAFARLPARSLVELDKSFSVKSGAVK